MTADPDRRVTDHHHGRQPLNDQIDILPATARDAGGRPIRYALRLPCGPLVTLEFSRPEQLDGLTDEALLAVLIDRTAAAVDHQRAANDRSYEHLAALRQLRDALRMFHARTNRLPQS